jgi:hypothetical protein
MRKHLAFVLLISLMFAGMATAQNASLKGTVVDNTDNKNLRNTVISLMQAKDSMLVRFARADQAGMFSITNLNAGEYILMITHPYLGDYFDKMQLGQDENKDLGKINMIPKSKLLAEVIIKSGSPIRIKGDTTVYTADSFKVREGANVEELLRRLPGIQVDKDGKITAMGERVTKVLVDGEEFFGSDPGIATKNLRADVVKEVEVFDKKSDQAEFTGIDDGVKNKTINLKLKDEKKKGYFGKVEAGGGLPDMYSNSAMLNAFRSKRKIAAYGIMSNTGKTNLDWEDANNYGGGVEGLESGISEDGGMYMMWNGNDDDNYRGGRKGIPRNWNAGLHYSNKFNNNKQSVNAGYKFSKVNAPGITTSFSKTFLPDTSWSTNSVSDNYNSTSKHAFNLIVETTIDSFNTLKWTTRANENKALSRSAYFTESFADNLDSINNSRRNSSNNSVNDAITSTLLWRHKFKKQARTLSVNAEFNWNRSDNDGLLYAVNNYYRDGLIEERDTLDQQNIRNNEGKSLSTRIAYTEPLSKDMYLELSYGFNFNGNSNERITNQKDGGGKYTDRIDSLSNLFEFNRLVHTPGLNFRINKKKYSYSFGSSVALSRFIQKNITEGLRYNYHFTNFFPRASFTYKLKPSENIRFNYNGSTQAPSLEQLQPIRVNTDPLNIYIGNPNLDQAFRHSFNLNYGNWNALKERNLWAGLNFNLTQNAFSQFNSVDSVGRRVYQTVNVDGIYNLNLYSDYGFKIPDTKWRFGFGPNLNFNRNIDFIRDAKSGTTAKNITDTRSYGTRINISQHVNDKYNFWIGPNLTWNTSKASVNSNANADYWQIETWAQGNVTLPWKFEIGTDLNFQVRKKDPRFPANNNFTTWNANIVKRILKNELEFRVTIYDILNENRGYNRSFSSYNFTETYFNTLRRFWMFSVTWNISKNGKPASF